MRVVKRQMQARSWYYAPALHRLGFTTVGNGQEIFKPVGLPSRVISLTSCQAETISRPHMRPI